MSDRERTENGTFRETVTPGAVLGVFDDVRGPVVTSSDVSEALGCTTEAARQKLATLYDRGEVDKRKTGRTVVYWRPDGEGIGPVDPEVTPDPQTPPERSESRPDRSEGQRDPTPPATDSTPSDDAQDVDTPDTVEATLRELDLPGSGGKLEARIEAIGTMYAHLREHAGDPVEKGALLELVDPDAVGFASRPSFWNNCVMANKSQNRDSNALVALPGVEDWGGGEYRFTTGDDVDAHPVEDADVYDPSEDF